MLLDYWSKAPVQNIDLFGCIWGMHILFLSCYLFNHIVTQSGKENNAAVLTPHTTNDQQKIASIEK